MSVCEEGGEIERERFPTNDPGQTIARLFRQYLRRVARHYGIESERFRRDRANVFSSKLRENRSGRIGYRYLCEKETRYNFFGGGACIWGPHLFLAIVHVQELRRFGVILR